MQSCEGGGASTVVTTVIEDQDQAPIRGCNLGLKLEGKVERRRAGGTYRSSSSLPV